LRKRFLKPGTIGLIPTAGYTGKINYSKKALMWLVYRKETDGCRILHGGNGREYRLPDIPNLSVDGFCAESRTVYEFLGCYWHGHTCLHYRDVRTMCGDTLVERYEWTIERLEKITRAVYQVVQKGYRFLKAYEVYEYRVTRYDRQMGDGGIFAQYIDTFLKLKAESSGYPDWVQSFEDEDRYVREFQTSEGITLDRDAIRPNPAKRGLAKLCLNSMWGKLTAKQ
jgi:G:T-mismatch repair DNA endonuclease (very short patch repair protein)